MRGTRDDLGGGHCPLGLLFLLHLGTPGVDCGEASARGTLPPAEELRWDRPCPAPSLPEDLEVKLDGFLRVSEMRDGEAKATPELRDREDGQAGC